MKILKLVYIFLIFTFIDITISQNELQPLFLDSIENEKDYYNSNSGNSGNREFSNYNNLTAGKLLKYFNENIQKNNKKIYENAYDMNINEPHVEHYIHLHKDDVSTKNLDKNSITDTTNEDTNLSKILESFFNFNSIIDSQNINNEKTFANKKNDVNKQKTIGK